MRVTIAEAAKLLDRSEEFVRIALQQEALPIGMAIRMHNSTRYTYHINPADLAKYMGLSSAELEAQIKKLAATQSN